jgi:hypothetical protein
MYTVVTSAEVPDIYIVLASINISACSWLVSMVIIPVDTDSIVRTPTVVKLL